MILLAIDTAANLCAACVWQAGVGERGREARDIGKGHAEQLMEVVDRAFSAAGVGMHDIDAIAVSTGPGSFTGVRIGVAAARGLALALKVPAIGISTLDALADEARVQHPGRDIVVAIDAGRGMVYASGHAADGRISFSPAELDIDTVAGVASSGNPVVTGSAADKVVLAAGKSLEIAGHGRTADIAAFARLAAHRDIATAGRPKPLYLRGADAAPQVGFALPRRGTS